MWAHYGIEGAGICLGFDEETLVDQFPIVYVGDVEYADKPATIDSELVACFCLTALNAGSVPFRLHDHLIVVHGAIGQADGLNMIIDTGATHTVVSEELAGRLNLKGTFEPARALGENVVLEQVILPSLSLGSSLQIKMLSAYVGKLQNLSAMVDVLIGMDLLKRTGLSVDYEKRQVSFGSVDPLSERLAFLCRASSYHSPFFRGRPERLSKIRYGLRRSDSLPEKN